MYCYRFVPSILTSGLLCLSFVAAPFASAAEGALTLAGAQRLAAERSQQLSAQDSAVSAARDMAISARQLPDPTLKAGIENLPTDGPDAFNVTRDFMTMRRIGVMQELTRDEKRQLRAERFEREAERSLAEKSATLAVIQRDTALAWLDRHYAEAMAGAVAEQIAAARLEIDAADSAYRGGKGSQAEILVARAAVVSFEDRASDLGRRIRTAKTALARWIGAAAESPLAARPDIDVVAMDPSRLDAQLEHHPMVATLARQVEIAATEVKLAQASKKPDWTVELMYSVRGPAYSNMVSLGVAVPLQWDQKNRQDRDIAAKVAMVSQAEAQREDALRAHAAEVRSMLHEWDNLRERRARYERELLPLAIERTRAVLTAYRGARASLGEVLAARRGEIEARLQTLQLETDQARVWAQLNFLDPHAAQPAGAAR